MKVGLALGSGAARGWAHFGVIQALESAGIVPDIIGGTSVGALIGGAYLTGQLDGLRSWAKSLKLLRIIGLLDVTFSRGGLVAIEKVFERFRNSQTDVRIETLPKTFATVATDLATGREVWLREGPLLDVVRASAAMPGMFPPVFHEGMWLVDGALVNPVPVSMCRALGADVVIAVNLNSELMTLPRLAGNAVPAVPPEPVEPKRQSFRQLAARMGLASVERDRVLTRDIVAERPSSPSVVEAIAGSIDIMQDRVTRSRLAGDPPDITIAPRLGHIGILDFERADELIELGRLSAEAMLPSIRLAMRQR